jgi:hypothetical protein
VKKPSATAKRLEAVRSKLEALGIKGFAPVVGAAVTLERNASDVEAARQVYLGLIATARGIVTEQLGTAARVLAQTAADDPARSSLENVSSAFRDQLEALSRLAAYLEGGDEALLDSAMALFKRAVKAAPKR